ncbi:MAG: hypothetical protein HKN16_10180 [Saprospiraceae bacterium]|nr:hypothetical protein [Saprospiraceae bacterium]
MRLLIIVFALFPTFITFLNAQETRREVILESLQAEKDISTRCSLYLDLADAYIGIDGLKAINYCLVAYNEAHGHSETQWEMKALAKGAESMLFSESPDPGAFRMLQLLRGFHGEKLDGEAKLRIHLIESHLSIMKADHVQALELCNQIPVPIENENLNRYYSFLKSELAKKSGDTISALGFLKDGVAKSDKDDYLHKRLRLDLAELYLKKGDPEQSQLYIDYIVRKDLLSKMDAHILCVSMKNKNLNESSQDDIEKQKEDLKNLSAFPKEYLSFLIFKARRAKDFTEKKEIILEALQIAESEDLPLEVGTFRSELLQIQNQGDFVLGQKIIAKDFTEWANEVIDWQKSSDEKAFVNSFSLLDAETTLDSKNKTIRNYQKKVNRYNTMRYWGVLLLLLLAGAAGFILFKLHGSNQIRKGLDQMLMDRTIELKESLQSSKEANSLVQEKEKEIDQILSHSIRKLSETNRGLKREIEKSELSYEGFREPANQLDFLVSEMVDYQKLRKDGDRHSSIDLKSSVSDVVENLRSSLANNGLVIEMDDLPFVEASEVHMRQVFQNLILDSMAYSSANPKIKIRHQEMDREHHFSIQNGSADLGSQIKAAIHELFGSYPAGKFHPGAGMSLSLVKKIIADYSGRIWLETGPGLGSIFHFSIPK